MNRRPTDLRRYVLVRNLKRYVKAHETIVPSNGNQEGATPQDVKEEVVDPSNIKQEIIDPPNVKQEIIDPQTEKEERIQSCSSMNSEQTAQCSSPSNTISSSSVEEVSENSSTEDSAASKDTDLNTSAFALVASLFKPRKKRKKGIAKAKSIVKQVKCKKQSSLACAKEKDPILKKPKSLFTLFKTRKEKRNNMLGNKNIEPCSSCVSSSPETTSQSCQTDITWPVVGYDELQRNNLVLQESNRLLTENLSTLIQNTNTKTMSAHPLGVCTDAYSSDNVNVSVEPQPRFRSSTETELRSPVRTRSHASKLHRSQTLVENSKINKICTRSKSMLNPDRRCSPLRTCTKTRSNFHHSSPYQLRSTILKDLPVNTNHGIHRRSSMPERTSLGPTRPLLRRRSNNFFDYNHGSISYPLQSNVAHSSHKPLSENFSLIKVKKSIIRRSSMPDRVPKNQISYRRSTVQRCNTYSFQDKHNYYKQVEYNRSTRFQDLPSEAFY